MRALFITGNLARLSNGFITLAILLLVRSASGSYTVAGVAVAASFAMMTLSAAPLGRMVDTRGQRVVLLPTALAAALAMTGLAIAGWVDAPPGLLIALAALTGIMPPVSSSLRAILSDTFADDERHTAFALESILQEIIWTAGPLVGTLVLVLSGPPAMLLTAAGLVLVGTALFAANPRSRDWRAAPRVQGDRSAIAHPGLRTMLMLSALAAVSFGQFEVSVPAFTDQHGDRRLAGLILALWAVGSAIGGLVYGTRISHAPAHRRLIATATFCAVGFVPAALAPNLWVLGAFALIAGAGIAPLLSVIYSTTGSIAPDGMTTEAFAWLNVAFPAGFTLGAPIAGVLADTTGPRVAMAAAGVAIALGVLLTYQRRGTLAPPT